MFRSLAPVAGLLLAAGLAQASYPVATAATTPYVAYELASIGSVPTIATLPANGVHAVGYAVLPVSLFAAAGHTPDGYDPSGHATHGFSPLGVSPFGGHFPASAGAGRTLPVARPPVADPAPPAPARLVAATPASVLR